MSRLAFRLGSRTPFVLLAAAIATGVLATAALAAGFTLSVKKNAKVTNTSTGKSSHANLDVTSKGFAVYMLTGDSRTHPQCTSKKCLQFWPPLTVKSAKKLTHASAVKGKLGTWKRKGFIQVTLNGHPLYTFLGDAKPGVATGEGIANFGGVWHPMLASGKAFAASSGSGGGGGY